MDLFPAKELSVHRLALFSNLSTPPGDPAREFVTRCYLNASERPRPAALQCQVLKLLVMRQKLSLLYEISYLENMALRSAWKPNRLFQAICNCKPHTSNTRRPELNAYAIQTAKAQLLYQPVQPNAFCLLMVYTARYSRNEQAFRPTERE